MQRLAEAQLARERTAVPSGLAWFCVLPSAYALGYLNAAAFGGWLLPPSLAAGPVFTKENPTLWVLYVSRLLATCVGLQVARVERVLLGRR